MTKKRSLDKFSNSVERLVDTKEDKTVYYGGILGTFDSLGNEIVDVPGRSNFSYVRLNGSLGEVIEAFNITVQATFGLKVKVAKRPGEFFYEVVGLDLAQYTSWGDGGTNALLPKHAFTHSFGEGTSVGTDPVFIFKRQLLQPMGMQPVGTGTAFYGYVNPDFYIWDNEIQYFEGAYTDNLSGLKPSNTQSRFVTVYLDGNTGNLAYKTGSLFTPASTVAAQIANIPEVNIITEGLPLNAVYLTSGTASLTWSNMFDIRNFLNAGGQIGSLTGSSSNVGTTITGIAEGAVLFGSPTGTILWDYNNFRWIDNSNQLIIGGTGLLFSTNSRVFLIHTGTFAGITMVGFGADGGAFFGRAINGTPALPSGTPALKRLMNFEGSGHDMDAYTSFRARFASISQQAWKNDDTPAYWEMWTTNTGSTSAEIVARWYGGRQDVYKPLHLEVLRFGTGVYTEFTRPTGSAVNILYKLPESQGAALTVLRNDGLGNLSWAVGGSSSSYPTGVPDNVVLFGRTGTISWNQDAFVWDDSRIRIIIGAATTPNGFTTQQFGDLMIVATGQRARVDLISYDTAFGGEFAGYAVGGSPGTPTGTPPRQKLVALMGGGHSTSTVVEEAASFMAYSKNRFTLSDISSYWEMKAATGTTRIVTNRWYGDFEEHLSALHLGQYLRFNTGSIYTQFNPPTGASAPINYKLPEAQGAVNTFLRNDGSGNLSWTTGTSGGGGGTPAGSDTWIQYNNAGAFGAVEELSWNNTEKELNTQSLRLDALGLQNANFYNAARNTIYSDFAIPAQITADQNTYGANNATVLELSTDATRTIHGLSGTFEGRVRWLVNIGSNSLVLANESSLAIDRHRFALPNDFTLGPGMGVKLWWDSGFERWRVFGAFEYGLTGNIQSVGSINLPGTSHKVARADHVHANIAGGYPTGVPNDVILFGKTGTIGWDTAKFVFLDSTDQFIVGSNSIPFSSINKVTLLMTGTHAGVDLVGYGSNGGGIFGRAAGGTQASPTTTNANISLVSLEGLGYENSESYTTFRAKLNAITNHNWASGSTPAFWEMWATATGSKIPEVVARWFGSYQDTYKGLHLAQYLRFGTGSIYTQFNPPTGAASAIVYKLPEAQGAANEILKNDGSGNLFWGTVTGASSGPASAGGYPTGIPDNVILYGKTGTIGWQSDFVFKSDKLGINVADPLTSIHLVQSQTPLFRGWLSDQYGNHDDGPNVWLRKSRGTTGSQSAVTIHDSLGEYKWSGFDGTAMTGTVARITVKADETFTALGHGTRMEFWSAGTGNATAAINTVLHGDYNEILRPLHLERLRFATGGNYYQFRQNPAEFGVIGGAFTGSVFKTGTVFFESGEFHALHVRGGIGPPPTIVIGTGIGPRSLVVLLTGSNDQSGRIWIMSTGNFGGNGGMAVARLTYGTPYKTEPVVIITPGNTAAINNQGTIARHLIATGGVNGFNLVSNTAPPFTGTHIFYYHVL